MHIKCFLTLKKYELLMLNNLVFGDVLHNCNNFFKI